MGGRLKAGRCLDVTLFELSDVPKGMPQYGGRNPFELGQANGTFVLANATVDADAKEVHLKPLHNNIGIATVVAGRYYWQGFPLCVLYNGDGLPATPFFHTLKIDDDYVRVLCCAVFGDSRQPHILIQLLKLDDVPRVTMSRFLEYRLHSAGSRNNTDKFENTDASQ